MKVANHKVENINGPLNPVNPTRLLWPGLLLLFGLLKLWLVTGVELGKDEAAYWHWGQHLDATYALLPFGILRLAHTIYPHQEWFLRLPSIFSSALATLLLYRLCRLHLLSLERARWASALFATSHWIWHTGSYLHPDGFLVTCWLLALYYARLAIDRQTHVAFAKIGFAIGLALLCKYSGAFLAAPLFLWILLAHPARTRYRFFLCALIPALLVAAPLSHAQLQPSFYLPFTLSSLSQIAVDRPLPLRLLYFLLNPIFFISPLLLYLLYRTWGQSFLDLPRERSSQNLLIFLPALAPVAAFAFFALFRGQIKGNWILPAFLSLWPLAFSTRLLPLRTRIFPIAALAIGLLHALTVAVALRYPGHLETIATAVGDSSLNATYVRLVSTPDQQREPTYSWTERLGEYHGWADLADRFEELLVHHQIPAATPLASTQYGIPFGLSYYSSIQRPYYTVDDPRFRHLTDFHEQSGAEPPEQILFLVRSGSALPPSLQELYPHRQNLGPVSRIPPDCRPIAYQLTLLHR